MSDETNKLQGEDNETKLDEELETLRTTFQEQYDETVAEAENAGPVIQELEDGVESDDEDVDEDESSDSGAEDAPVEKKPKKKRKAGKIAAITILVTVVVLVIGSLLAYVVASVSNPNFSSFISAYAQAGAAEKYDDKIKYLENALGYCSDEESVFQQAMAATIKEEIAIVTYNEKGFMEAYSYMKAKMTAEQIKNPVSGELKKIVKTLEKADELSLELYLKVFEQVGDGAKAPDAAALCEELGVPEDIKEVFVTAINQIAEGYILNKKSTDIENSLVAMSSYGNAYSALCSVGADERALAEKVCVVLYNEGLIVESVVFSSVAVDPSKDNVNEDYTVVKGELAAFKEIGVSVVTLAESAVKDEKTGSADVLSLVKERVSLKEENVKVVATLVEYAVQAIKSETEGNLTKASTEYSTLASVLEAFGIADVSSYIKTVNVILKLGNLSDASTLVTTYLTDEALKSATEEEKQMCDNMKEIFEGLNAASEVFSPYYAQYYQNGTAMNYEEVSGKLDELIKEDSSDYLKGFVAYCKYFAAISADTDMNRRPLIDEMARYMPDLPFVFGYYYIDEYLQDRNFAAAENYANKLLEVNIADGYANSILALTKRIDGDFDGAVEVALKGIELAGSSSDCEKQLAIAYMLKGDFESAFGHLNSFYSNGASIDSCDLMLVFNKLYTGANEEIKSALASAVAEIQQTYSYYGVTSYKDTTAVLNGEMTLEDVYMSGNCDLADE